MRNGLRVALCLLLAAMLGGCSLLQPFMGGGPKVGDVATLSNPVGESAFVCNDVAEFDEVNMTLTRKRDLETWHRVEKSGAVFFVVNKTRVNVVEVKTQPATSRVQIVDGSQKGKTGWVRNNWLTKVK